MIDKQKQIDEAEARYREAERKLNKQSLTLDKMFSDKTSDNLRKGVTMEQFNAELRKLNPLQRTLFSTLDRWMFLQAHVSDRETVPEDEVRNVINMGISDKLDGVQFTVNYGILAAKVAQSIRMNVIEADTGDVPLCVDHR